MNTDPIPLPSPAPESLALKLARSVVAIGLALTLTLITGLAVLGYVAVAKAAVEPIFKFGGEVSHVAVGVTVIFIVLLPLIVFFVAARKRWLTWPVLGAGWLAAGAIMLWLAWDDPAIRQPLPMEQFSPAFAGAEQSDAVLMRYSQQKSDDETKAFGAVKWKVTAMANPRDTAKWRDFVTKYRDTLEADWVTLAPQRRWLDELNAFDRIGDVTPTRFDANVIRFDVWRVLGQRTCAHATVLAMEGRGDEAVATLVPLLEVSRKLQPSARTLIRFMVAVVVEHMAVETAAIVLELTPVGPASRARLAAALEGRNAAAGARRIMLMEYASFAPRFAAMKLGDTYARAHDRRSPLRRPLNGLTALVFNPNATTNIYGDRVFELAALAEARELGKLAVRSRGFDDAVLTRGGMKNLGGRLMLTMAIPSYDKVLESYWKLEDECAALAVRAAGKG
jgi:hypothetical protein